jgi:hypothetical protein
MPYANKYAGNIFTADHESVTGIYSFGWSNSRKRDNLGHEHENNISNES